MVWSGVKIYHLALSKRPTIGIPAMPVNVRVYCQLIFVLLGLALEHKKICLLSKEILAWVNVELFCGNNQLVF